VSDEPKFTSEALKKAFKAMTDRPRTTFNSLLVMGRDLAAQAGIDVSVLPGNLVKVHGGKIEGIYIEPEEPVEKRTCPLLHDPLHAKRAATDPESP